MGKFFLEGRGSPRKALGVWTEKRSARSIAKKGGRGEDDWRQSATKKAKQ